MPTQKSLCSQCISDCIMRELYQGGGIVISSCAIYKGGKKAGAKQMVCPECGGRGAIFDENKKVSVSCPRCGGSGKVSG